MLMRSVPSECFSSSNMLPVFNDILPPAAALGSPRTTPPCMRLSLSPAVLIHERRERCWEKRRSGFWMTDLNTWNNCRRTIRGRDGSLFGIISGCIRYLSPNNIHKVSLHVRSAFRLTEEGKKEGWELKGPRNLSDTEKVLSVLNA